MTALFFGSLDGGLQVTRIVERVEDTDDINTVGNRLLHKVFDHVVGIMAAENILTAEEHLQFCVFDMAANGAQSVPRIFI